MLFYQPCGVEAINPGQPRITMGKVARQGAQVAIFADEFLATEDFGTANWDAAQARLAGEQIVFFRFERTGAINERTARLGQGERSIKQTALQRGKLDDIVGAFEPRHVGMAADGPGRGAWRVEEYDVERFRHPFLGIGED